MTAATQPGHAHGTDGAKPATGADLAKLALGALGVVYGDIGTSPLYAIKECFAHASGAGAEAHGVLPTPANVFGILSLIFWALTLVVAVKYLSFVMRADNKGEGGTLALVALLARKGGTRPGRSFLLVMAALFGTSLLYGEGIITPAISVLSAVEGLEVAAHDVFAPIVVPLTVAILVAIFLVQKRGTAGIGRVFGPATLIWFVAIALAGAPWILHRPSLLSALDPRAAFAFFVSNRLHGFLVLGSVVLCITGGEALYADMGHFGKRPIRLAWYAVVFPALLLNYFGQGALLLERCADTNSARCADAVANPFYALVDGWMLYPMIAIATAATIVASQALISGAYSLTQQAVQLGYAPRFTIVHTSGQTEGQIYVPEVNRGLMVCCIALVLAFRESSKLAAAYGIAVTGAMTITSVLFFAVARDRWKWPMWRVIALTGLFLSVDLSFFLANVAKLAHGGWLPLLVASVVFASMTTWKRGRATLAINVMATTLPLDLFLDSLRAEKPYRVPGTAVFMTQNPDGTPPALIHHFKHNKVLHQQVVLLSVRTDNVPDVPPEERVEVRALSDGFWHVTAYYGFMKLPNVPEVMQCAARKGLETVLDDTSFYLGRETLLPSGRSGMARWRKSLFVLMSRNAPTATTFFGLPPNRVVELGTQIEF